jgi:transcription antitermination factor NusG
VDGIKVRVVSDKVAHGKLYNIVVPVTNVHDSYTFEIYSKELNREFTDLKERDIETVLPKSKDIEAGKESNLTVKVVRGSYRGSTGVVKAIDKRKDKVTVLVEFTQIITIS